MHDFDNLSAEDAEYILNLPFHLIEAAKQEGTVADDLSALLTEYEFIEYKVFSLLPEELIEDYEVALNSNIEISQATRVSLKLVQSAIKLADNVLVDNPRELPGQLLGHLLSFEEPEIQALKTQIQEQKLGYPWLRPLTQSLTPAAGALLRTLDGHRDWVKAVAIASKDGKIAVSGSDDCTLRVWNLQTGAELSRLTGHNGSINGVAITPDGQLAVSASNDRTLKVWDLPSKTSGYYAKGLGFEHWD
jgi:WD40 repeat protein